MFSEQRNPSSGHVHNFFDHLLKTIDIGRKRPAKYPDLRLVKKLCHFI